MSCDLCNAEGENLSKTFKTLICRSCKVPMIVLRHHRPTINKSERKEAESLRRRHFSDKRFRGYMRKMPDHWHDHLI
jgi:hypothetical protein